MIIMLYSPAGRVYRKRWTRGISLDFINERLSVSTLSIFRQVKKEEFGRIPLLQATELPIHIYLCQRLGLLKHDISHLLRCVTALSVT